MNELKLGILILTVLAVMVGVTKKAEVEHYGEFANER